MRLARLESCEIGEAGNLAKCAVSPVRLPDASVDVVVPLEGLVDIAAEVTRIGTFQCIDYLALDRRLVFLRR